MRKTCRLAAMISALFLVSQVTFCTGAAPTVESPTTVPPSVTALPVSATSTTETDEDFTLVSNGLERSYHFYRPADLGPSPAPLVIFLHGSGSGGLSFRKALTPGLNAQARSGRFMVVYPDAATYSQQWNAGICCGDAVTQGVDDVAYIDRLITRISTDNSVDSNRVYIWGLSNGGMMAYRMACERSQRIAAIASSAGPLVVEPCQPTSPVSVAHIQSTTDEKSPFSGGMRPGPPDFVTLPVPSIVERWRELDDCKTPPVTERIGPVTRVSSRGCQGDTEVALITSDEGNHAYPLGYSADVTALVVAFFASHHTSP